MKPEHKLKFCQPRVVPYALRPKIEAELNCLAEMGVLSLIQYSECATPIVPVVKKNGAVHICGNFKVTVNPVLHIENYLLPCTEDLFTSLARGQCFSKLDLSYAYLHMRAEEEWSPGSSSQFPHSKGYSSTIAFHSGSLRRQPYSREL